MKELIIRVLSGEEYVVFAEEHSDLYKGESGTGYSIEVKISDTQCFVSFRNNQTSLTSFKNYGSISNPISFRAGNFLVYEKGVEPPTLLRKVTNFAKAITKHTISGFSTVSSEIQTARLSICRGCIEYFDSEKLICKHKDCGCYLPVKTSWASQSCPLSPPKWGPVQKNPPEAGCGC
jgi:hypothetical protein